MSLTLVKPQVNTCPEKICSLSNQILMFIEQSWGELLLCVFVVLKIFQKYSKDLNISILYFASKHLWTWKFYCRVFVIGIDF